MHIRCFFFMPYEIYIYKSMKNISSFLENQKRGEEEKNCQMWGSLVCCTLSLFCVFPPCACPWGKHVPRVAQVCWPQAGMDPRCPGLQQGLCWSPPCSAEVQVMLMGEAVGRGLHPCGCLGRPELQEKGQEAAGPSGRMLGSALKACWPLLCSWVRSNFGRFRFVQGKIPAELRLINQNL